MKFSVARFFSFLGIGLALFLTATMVSAQDGTQSLVATDNSVAEAIPEEGMLEGRYIVVFNGEPATLYEGGIRGLAPASDGPAAVDAYAAYLEAEQAAFFDGITGAVNKGTAPVANVITSFQHGISAALVELDAAAMRLIEAHPDVRFVQKDALYELHTDAGPAWIGAPSVWDGTSTGTAALGEGVTAVVLDSGVNGDHPSFAGTDKNGFSITNPLGAGVFLGSCDPADPNFDSKTVCTDKLVGVYDAYAMTGTAESLPDVPNGEDENGHGSHTAGTVAGNFVDANIALPAVAGGLMAPISGVAPHANLITFDVCSSTGSNGPGSSCVGAAMVAALDKTAELVASNPELNIRSLNFSISGGTNPYADAVELGFLNLASLNVYISASAGNSGPTAETVAHRGPWLQTVAASTHTRAFESSLINMSGGDTAAPADIVAKGITDGYGPAPIVYAGDFANPNDPGGDPAQCLQPFPAGTFSGEIVVCDRGSIARTAKGENVLAGGAGGYVLANLDAQGEATVADAHFLPGVHIGDADGDVVRAWLASGTGHMATISGYSITNDAANADIMAGFSSRGPNPAFDVLKPTITGPGVDVLAAVADGGDDTTGDEYDFISGTSMSSPHSAGMGALIASANPTWSAQEIKSAMMMTAVTAPIFKEDGTTPADPFDVGAGSARVNLAAQAGLVMDETRANYEAADPALGGDVRELNVPSMMNSGCIATCSWTRTVKSSAAGDVTWDATGTGLNITVTPANFTLAPGATQELVITVDATGLAEDTFVFGQVDLTPSLPARSGFNLPPAAHMPVAVQAVGAVLPDLERFSTALTSGTRVIADNISGDIASMSLSVAGLVEATLDAQALPGDSDNSSPYDDVTDGAFVVNVAVPADGVRLVAEITESDAPDIDLFVGTGSTPSAATQVCSSTTASFIEYCDVSGDDLVAGDYWILVQNWSPSAPDAVDAVTLAYGVVTAADAGNMTAAGPASVSAGVPFDIELDWNEPAMVEGDRWYGAVNVADAGRGATDIGTINVDIVVVPPEALAVGGPAVGFEQGIPSTFTVTDDAGEGLVWTLNGEASCVDEGNYVTAAGSVACASSDGFGTGAYDTSLISNEIDMATEAASCDTVELDFLVNYRDVNNPNLGRDQMDVDVSVDGGTSWTNILKLEDDIGGFRQDASGVAYDLDLADYLNDASVQVRFRYYNPDDGASAFDWWAQVDDISLECVTSPQIDVQPGSLEWVVPVDYNGTQPLTISNPGTADLNWTMFEDSFQGRNVPSEILYEVGTEGTGGIISDDIVDSGFGTYSAEEFVLDAFSRIDLLFTPGFRNNGPLPAGTPITWRVFADDGGAPMGDPGSGMELFTYTANSDSTGVDVTDNNISLDLAAAGQSLELGAGTYWLSVAATSPTTDGDERWNWSQGVAGDADAQLFDEGNFGGLPWTLLTDLGVSWGDLALRIEGEVTEISLCSQENDISYISIGAENGTIAPGMSEMVDVTADATGLMVGSTYTSTLCINSNAPDPARAQFEIPLTVTVIDQELGLVVTRTVGTDPNACATTDAITVEAGTTVYHCVTAHNTGNVPFSTHSITDVDSRDQVASFDHDLLPGATVVITHATATALGFDLAFTVDETTTTTMSFFSAGDFGTAVDTDSVTVTVSEGLAVALQQPEAVSMNRTVIVAALTLVLTASAVYVTRRKRA